MGTAENPADVLSRGSRAGQIEDCKLWWEGPNFLQEPEELWPSEKCAPIPEDIPEVLNLTIFESVKCEILDKFSSYRHEIPQ